MVTEQFEYAKPRMCCFVNKLSFCKTLGVETLLMVKVVVLSKYCQKICCSMRPNPNETILRAMFLPEVNGVDCRQFK